MEQMNIGEFKAIVDSLCQNNPDAKIDFVVPYWRAKKRASRITDLTSYRVLMSSFGAPTVRFVLDYADPAGKQDHPASEPEESQ